MATKRKTLSKKTRFEVFKRDSFKCQYCGAAAPDVILEVDHIDPLSKDGADEMVNYITACRPCNAGKSDRKLDDNATLAKQRAQLEELNERREQLEMMLGWRNSLKDINEEQISALQDAWKSAAPGWSLNEKGLSELRKHFKKHGLSAVLDAIDTVSTQYIEIGEDGNATAESTNLGWSKLGGVLRMSSMPNDERELYYIKEILKNRLSYVVYDVIKHLSRAVKAGVPVDEIKLEAKHTRNWTQFLEWLDDAIGGVDG